MSIVELDAFKRSKGQDDAAFLICPVCEAQEFAIVVRFAVNKPFVAHLVCVSEKCDGEQVIDVINGELS